MNMFEVGIYMGRSVSNGQFTIAVFVYHPHLAGIELW